MQGILIVLKNSAQKKSVRHPGEHFKSEKPFNQFVADG